MERIGLQHIDPALHACITACEDCLSACEHAANVCVGMDGMGPCLRALRDCADLCALTIRFMARHAALSPELCEVCAKACDVVEEECGRHEGTPFQTCVEACRRCAELCKEVAI